MPIVSLPYERKVPFKPIINKSHFRVFFRKTFQNVLSDGCEVSRCGSMFSEDDRPTGSQGVDYWHFVIVEQELCLGHCTCNGEKG